MSKTIEVKLGQTKQRSYPVIIGSGTIDSLGARLKTIAKGANVFLITDSRVGALYAKRVKEILGRSGFSQTGEFRIPQGETNKNWDNFSKAVDRLYLFAASKSRKTVVVTLGGGVPGDLGGFAAGAYKRGIDYVQVPTTLLGQVDCGLGGKVAVNLRAAKNIVGFFWQPKLVLMDTDFLSSLPQRELKAGLAEAIKCGVIGDPGLFSFIEKNIEKILSLEKTALNKVIYSCVRLKADVVSRDERDTKDIRIKLNFGHTIGHAIEAATGYKRYKHGEAIAIGMAAAGRIAAELGIFPAADLSRMLKLIQRAGLPGSIRGCRPDAVLRCMRHDKKFLCGINRFVLPVRIGRVKVVEDINEKTILRVLSGITVR